MEFTNDLPTMPSVQLVLADRVEFEYPQPMQPSARHTIYGRQVYDPREASEVQAITSDLEEYTEFTAHFDLTCEPFSEQLVCERLQSSGELFADAIRKGLNSRAELGLPAAKKPKRDFGGNVKVWAEHLRKLFHSLGHALFRDI